MTTRKHEFYESLNDDLSACPYCMEREADAICERCLSPACVECLMPTDEDDSEEICPCCR